MSSKHSKKRSEKEKSINSLSSFSKKDGKEKNNKAISEQAYTNTLDNLKNLMELGKDLKGTFLPEYKDFLEKYQKENEKLNDLYENEDKVNNVGDKNCKLNDDIFEQQAIKILSDAYHLKEKINTHVRDEEDAEKLKEINIQIKI